MINLVISAADITATQNTMRSVVQPIIDSLSLIAGLICAGFIINAGIHYITSSGKPEKLERAKRIMRDALIGLVLVLGAATLTSILSHAYGSPSPSPAEHLPALTSVKPSGTSLTLVDVLVKAITGVLQNIIESIGSPIINTLSFFTSGTPFMAENGSVFKLWLATVAVADVLFVLAVCFLGFHIMSASTFGLDEIEFKHLLPQLGLIFLLINSSIFAIDMIISLSNGMIDALRAGFGNNNVWQVLVTVTDRSAELGLATLLIELVFLVLSFMLLVYYVGRLVTLYLGAVLSPLILLLWLLPSFKDFATSATKTYLITIFVLFVHVVILLLAASIFASLIISSSSQLPDPIMTLVVGLSTIVALIKTQGVLAQLNYASVGPKSLRRLGGQFMNAINNHAVSYRST